MAQCMFGGGALAAKIVGFGFSQGSFLSASRLSRDGRKNSRKEVPKSRFYRDWIIISKRALTVAFVPKSLKAVYYRLNQ